MFGIRTISSLAFGAVFFPLALLFPQLVTESTSVTSFVATSLFAYNLHETIPGEFYRSGEISHDELGGVIDRLGIKTVVDLRRGGDRQSSDGSWEKEIVLEHGARYFSVPLNGTAMPSIDIIRKLIRLYGEASGPILVHCSSGSHRSSLAAFIFLVTQRGVDPIVAANQFSTRFGYFSWERVLKSAVKGRPTIDNLVWQYLSAYQESGVSFVEWVDAALVPEDWKISANS